MAGDSELPWPGSVLVSSPIPCCPAIVSSKLLNYTSSWAHEYSAAEPPILVPELSIYVRNIYAK